MKLTVENIGGAGHGQRAWVAEITGADPKFGLKRRFLRGIRDYAKADSGETRRVETTYTLKPGHFYEVSNPKSCDHIERYFCDGNGNRLTRDQVLLAVHTNPA